jgi:hypothetical protein
MKQRPCQGWHPPCSRMPWMSSSFFTVLTLIVAPAVLTNASSVLALNTANRFARIIDRAKELAAELRHLPDGDPQHALRLLQLQRLGQRAEFLLRAQSSIYAALGLFVTAALVAVVGAGVAIRHPDGSRVIAMIGLGVGILATSGLIHGSQLIIRDTRLALVTLREDLAMLTGVRADR